MRPRGLGPVRGLEEADIREEENVYRDVRFGRGREEEDFYPAYPVKHHTTPLVNAHAGAPHLVEVDIDFHPLSWETGRKEVRLSPWSIYCISRRSLYAAPARNLLGDRLRATQWFRSNTAGR